MDDAEYFKLRKAGKTYISKVFKFGEQSTERVRQIRMVMEGSDSIQLGEIEGALCLRLTGEKRKTQVTALVTQDHKSVRRVSLHTYQSRSGGWYQGYEEKEFTFRSDELLRLLGFLRQIEFMDLSNEENFQIEDISTQAGAKAIIDASDRDIVERVRGLEVGQRDAVLEALRGSLTSEELNLLLGRRQGLEEFTEHMSACDWAERDWQDFFEREQWVFGYGLDYRVMRHFDREMVVGSVGTDNRNKPTVDFLGTFTEYTVLVEIKRPDTRIFRTARGGRAGTWEFSADFMSSVSQIIQQKAEWLAFAQSGDHWNKAGTKKLEARTRNAKTVLIIGSLAEFSDGDRNAKIKRDTFELFRRENRTIDILTFDEVLERARFIARSS